MSISLQILAQIIALFVGFIFYLFFPWRRLREDYEIKTIFRTGFLSFFVILLFVYLIYFVSDTYIKVNSVIWDKNSSWFWGAFLGWIISIWVLASLNKMRIFETLESFLIGFLWIGFMYFIANQKVESTIFLLFLLFFYFLDSKYKFFSWYKSGRVGFSGLSILGIFFITRSIVSLIWPYFYSYAGKIDPVLSSAVAFLCFFSLYNLSKID